MLREKRRLIVQLIVIFLVNIIIISTFQLSDRADAAGYKKGYAGGAVSISSESSIWAGR